MFNKAIMLTGLLAIMGITVIAQNLVINPGAELLPAGTGWTAASSGIACASGTAASTYNSWTMTPDASANYPAAHGGTKTFFAGCSNSAGTFELYQDINVSADATQIDASNVEFVFSGYIQTPISGQDDRGQFTVDFLNASNAVLGTSYTASQARTTGSGITWNAYNNTRTAPVGTRTVRVRLISSITTTPAINAYFDDISLVKNYIVPLPVTLVSFDAKPTGTAVALNWRIADAIRFDRFAIERADDQQHFTTIAIVSYKNGKADYQASDESTAEQAVTYYRLKLIDIDGKYTYSKILPVMRTPVDRMHISPNPATSRLVVKGLHSGGTLSITTIKGVQVGVYQVRSGTFETGISHLAKGLYIVRYQYQGQLTTEKLMVK
jgi:hypothetical protein